MRYTRTAIIAVRPSDVWAVLTFTLTGPMACLARLLAGGRIRRYVDMEAAGLKRQSENRANT